jgi:hypothetical protein
MEYRVPRTMPALSIDERQLLGKRAASGHMYRQDKVWSRYSNDKVDISWVLARVLRTLGKSLPLDQPFTALSIGSSNEPQFRILESAFRGGLCLVDIEEAALAVVEERIQRQNTPHVQLVRGDYREVFGNESSVLHFRKEKLGGQRTTLITLHHSLYYSPQSFWHGFLTNLFVHLLAEDPGAGPTAAIHAVLMASRSDDPSSTTWLYNHFAGRFFNHQNDQDLLACAAELSAAPAFQTAQVLTRSSRVEFFVDDFEQFMAVVWMILLHPNVHCFSDSQQQEVIEWVYTNLWSRGLPLVQIQDHLVIYRGKGIAGLI